MAMDRLIAEKVLGWIPEDIGDGELAYWEAGPEGKLPNFTTNRDHAFMVWDSAEKSIGSFCLAEHMMGYWLKNSRDDVGYLSYFLHPENLCRAILDVKCPGWEETK
jgi:hypothetical protein